MKLENWDITYNHFVRWALRRMEPDTLEFYHDNFEDWVHTLQMLNTFETELFKRFYTNNKSAKFRIRSREWDTLCRKYIHKGRKTNDRTMANFFFQIWNDCRWYFKSNNNLYLSVYSNWSRPITDKELEYANKYLIPELKTEAQQEAHRNTVWFSKNSKVLTYRGINAPIDDIWGCAHLLYKGEKHDFSLDWDWWYPIDMFIDLTKCWKRQKEGK